MEPERGTTTYSYTYNGTGLQVTRTRPQANQTNPSVTTTTTTQYDSLGRVVTIAYSDGTTPKRNYTYDAPVAWQILSQQNVKGRLSLAFSTIAPSCEASIFSYDAMGEIAAMGKALPSGCSGSFDKLLSYSRHLLGNVTGASDGGGVTISYQFSPASEVQSITSSLNDANHPGALVSNVQNGPHGPLTYQMGNGVN
jgi:YD repeat-containing protein